MRTLEGEGCVGYKDIIQYTACGSILYQIRIGPTYICCVLCGAAAATNVDVVHEAGEAGVADALDAFGDGTTIVSSCKDN